MKNEGIYRELEVAQDKLVEIKKHEDLKLRTLNARLSKMREAEDQEWRKISDLTHLTMEKDENWNAYDEVRSKNTSKLLNWIEVKLVDNKLSQKK